MKTTYKALFITGIFFLFSVQSFAQTEKNAPRINVVKDLLLVQYDCKTDVDDLHSVAAFRTILDHISNLNYYAVAGSYGIQEGLYVPPNELFELAFGKNWTDAHNNFNMAVSQVKKKVVATLKNGGEIWVAEAGQSDFTAAMLKAVQAELPDINTSQRIHVVQHSDWNENVTTPQLLELVKINTNYHKIPDGNMVGNGTPGFRTPEFNQWNHFISDPSLAKIWQLAIDLGIKYNGKDGRYNNQAVAEGGLDFSDTSEVCWILGLENLADTQAFFRYFSK